uniref:Uncharacterized protein n=1 Tax=Utricularia reniformis TaxID=192314 RepID=A0A1Y0B1Z3_9LAMI|nr:hypothetical protein AEK19_MT1258 [Utricularia reniformis]ART31466.1 hypothetical protein AEK19_MT1258 [Utricularia reniformis]
MIRRCSCILFYSSSPDQKAEIFYLLLSGEDLHQTLLATKLQSRDCSRFHFLAATQSLFYEAQDLLSFVDGTGKEPQRN